MTNNHTDRAHSLLGGSTANRWTNCPGSVFYIQELPPEEPSDAATEGTLAHEAAEKMLNVFLDYKITGNNSPYDTQINEEYFDGGEFYTNQIWKELLDQSITGKAYGLEEKFTIDAPLDMAGIVDFWAVYLDDKAKRCGVVADYKFGFTPVVARNNAQLAFYAVALRKEMKQAGKDLDLVYAAIIQPRLTDEKKRFQKVKFTGKQLDTWEKKFYKAAEQIFVQKRATFKVGDWCKFCPAKAICKEYTKKMKEKTSLKLIDPDEVTLPVPESMSKEALAKVILHYDTLKDFIDSCYTHVLNGMRAGKKFPGLKLIEGKPRRKWKEDETAIIKALSEHHILTTQIKLKGITEIEKSLVQEYNKEDAKEILSRYTELSIANDSVVSEDDPRPAKKNMLDNL